MSQFPPKHDPALVHNRATLLTALRDAGAAFAGVVYYSDNGRCIIDHILVVDQDDNDIPDGQAVVSVMREYLCADRESVPVYVACSYSLHDALKEFATRAVSLYHSNDKASGDGDGGIAFDCEKGTVSLSHTNYHVESVHSKHDL
ncbi:hypothetical protein CY652_20810 [Burkholderia sp. WAC0059]|uniref:hypothetical protein n=1 Tax=Burkholderia sp. WAC0059 TaxID=2066022 RepID=UPI000C7F746A|nr:hypothetical protein [Burkholderia sp. WAC0059]PLZ00444.1 hypothetical protein CY652_20810 [Burkholderia sp. WAC0059]